MPTMQKYYCGGKNISEVEEKLYQLSDYLVRWVNSNGLVLNLKKTLHDF